MSTKARKERKRAGIQFVHKEKVGTPYAMRVVPMIYDKFGFGHTSSRAEKKLKGYADMTTPKPAPMRKRRTLNPKAK